MLVSVILTKADTMISACRVVNPKQAHKDKHAVVVRGEKKKKPFVEREEMQTYTCRWMLEFRSSWKAEMWQEGGV